MICVWSSICHFQCATPLSIAAVKSRMVYLFDAGLPGCPEKRPLEDVVLVVVVIYIL